MSEIDPAKIAVQVAIACTRALDQRCPEIGATFVKIGDAHAFFHGTTALSNVVIASGCFGAIAGEDIDNVEEFFRRRQVAVTVLIPNFLVTSA